MTASDLSIVAGVMLAIMTSLGGAIAWIAARASAQAKRFDRMEERYNGLHREHTLVLVKMERFRLAFQIVAAELAGSNPKSSALVHARALLADNFIFPTDAQTQTPPDMEKALHEMDETAN